MIFPDDDAAIRDLDQLKSSIVGCPVATFQKKLRTPEIKATSLTVTKLSNRVEMVAWHLSILAAPKGDRAMIAIRYNNTLTWASLRPDFDATLVLRAITQQYERAVARDY